MRTEDEVKKQVTGVRERVKELSGFYIGEGAAMLYVLEWVLGKRETVPSGELGRAGGESGRIAENLTKLAEKAAEQAAKKKPAAEGAAKGAKPKQVPEGGKAKKR